VTQQPEPVRFKGPGQWRSAAEKAQAGAPVAVPSGVLSVHDSAGNLTGEIRMSDGTLTGSNTVTQAIAEQAVARYGSPQAAYNALKATA
jgi:hypothetical protein